MTATAMALHTTLTQDDRAKLIETYRDINVYEGWWDYIDDDFKGDMQPFGIRVDEVMFSGFYSQGSGACFTGIVTDITKLLAAMQHPQATQLGLFLDTMGCSIRIEHRSANYYHENTMHLDVESLDFALPGDLYYHDEEFDEAFEHLGALRCAALKAALQQVDYTTTEQDILEFLRDKARDLYTRLRDEYEHLTSDEEVWEAIVINDLHIDYLIDKAVKQGVADGVFSVTYDEEVTA